MPATENQTSPPLTSKRLAVLAASLAKKEAAFDAKLAAHFDDVRSANGQPLNDKRNGAATMGRWDRQDDALRTLKAGIEKTKAAIEREKGKIVSVESVDLPPFLAAMVAAGELNQWRRHPTMFFVPGVERARIVWYPDEKGFRARYWTSLPDEPFATFKAAFQKCAAAAKAFRAGSSA